MKTVRSIILDAMVIGGAGAAVFGVWQIHQPAAFIVGGVMAAGLGFAGKVRR